LIGIRAAKIFRVAMAQNSMQKVPQELSNAWKGSTTWAVLGKVTESTAA
jgi:hypothetical protein